ncbi:MAG TPA: ShlB/FhaC/HecB family hemolysin secretion/activation protein [Vicinamibacterales bacterium]|nr:ShlB/FhaC/HecB family hemolysin secretion/activation protein [Vicinamibacterales bacterium]
MRVRHRSARLPAGRFADTRVGGRRQRAGIALRLSVGSLLGVVLALTNAWGQTRPGTVQPGQVERQLEKPREPSARPGVITIPEPGQTPPPNAAGIQFVLNHVTVDGVTIYQDGALRRLYAGSLGREVTLADVYRIVDALTARYRNDGYILSQVIVPAQSVENGAVRLQAIEGYIAGVRVEGGSAAMNARVRRYIEKLRAVRPLTAAALERSVLLVNDIPGVWARAVLTPSSTPGAADLVLVVSQRPFATGLSVDTRGSRAQGRQRVFADVGLHSLFGGASLTELRGVSTADRELGYFAAAHDQLVGSGGAMIGVAGSYVYSRPQELAFIPLELTTTSQAFTLHVTHPLVRSRARNLHARAVVSVFDSRTEVFGVKDTADRLRAVRLGLTFDASDGLGGISLADLEFSQGIDALGASTNGDEYLSRPTGRSDFRKATLYAARLQSLPAHWSIALVLNAQYALTDLLSPELFAVGGEQFGRGYDFAELLNDHGIAAKLDLRYSHAWTGRRPATLMPYAFVDFGQVWQRTRFPGLDASQSAASAGGGFRLGLGHQLSAFVEFAKPLTKTIGQEKNRKGRIYAGLSVQ